MNLESIFKTSTNSSIQFGGLTGNNNLIIESGIGTVCKTINFVKIDPHEDDEYAEEDLIYPSLLEGTDLVEDSEWADILYDSAYGKLPPGFVVRNDGISYSFGGKKQSLLPSMDPKEAADETIKFFRTAGGIKTNMDVEFEQKVLIDARNKQDEEYRSLSWIKLKGGAKNKAVSCFADKLVERMKLPRHEQSNLETIINVGLNSGAIRDHDIIFAQGEITEIKSLSFDGQRFNLTSEAKSRTKIPIIKDTCPDDIYFDQYSSPPDPPSRKFSGFHGEWQKLARNIHKVITSGRTNRTIPQTNLTSSPSYVSNNYQQSSINFNHSPLNNNSQAHISRGDSILVNDWNKNIINSFKPTKFAFNPDNPLLSPRHLSYAEKLNISGLSNSTRTTRPVSSRRSRR